ncbi:MAG: hypothetical protein ACREFT_10375 [Acetobacteraceae bacterium]
MNTSRDRVSRWTPAIFASALVNLMLGLLLVISGLAWPAAPHAAPLSLAAVHLVTIGWLTLLMFGALFQFVPVITGRNLPSQRLPLVTLVGVELGLALMIAGFVFLGRGAGPKVLLPAGGAVVLVSLLIGGAALLVPLLGKRPRPLSAGFVLAGLGFLLATVVIGICFACALSIPASRQHLAPLLGGGLEYHVLAGLGGWFTLTAIGVSYELLPMFMLAPHERGALGTAVFALAVASFAVALLAGLAQVFSGLGWLGIAGQVGEIGIVIALALYLADVVRMYRGRRRKKIELHNRAAIGAFVSLGLAVLLGIAAAAAGRLALLSPVLVLLLLLGWLSGLGLTQLYKIIPFLSWLQHYGSRLGRGPVPRVQDLVNEARATGFFVLYFAAVAATLIAAELAAPAVTRAFLAVVLAAVILLAGEYRRAWTGRYVRKAGGGDPAPAPKPDKMFSPRIEGTHP